MGKDGSLDISTMSVSELPPIGCRSKPNTSHNSPSKTAAVMKYERPPLISAEDSTIVLNGSENGVVTQKRSRLSMESVSDGSSSAEWKDALSGSVNGTATTGSDPSLLAQRNRSRTWCSSEVSGTKSSTKLDTLYEKNGVPKNAEYVRQDSIRTSTRGSDIRLPMAVKGMASDASMQSFSMSKRTNSYTNLSLSRLSDGNNNSAMPNKNILPSKVNIHKVTSDQNLSCSNHRKMNGQRSSRVSNQERTHKPLTQSKSNPNFQTSHIETKTKLDSQRGLRSFKKQTTQEIAFNAYCQYNVNDVFGEVTEKDKRIHDWLIRVQSEAEAPPTPDIIEDEPPQTDTAIHVVYGEEE